jgi:hypothetical protein
MGDDRSRKPVEEMPPPPREADASAEDDEVGELDLAEQPDPDADLDDEPFHEEPLADERAADEHTEAPTQDEGPPEPARDDPRWDRRRRRLEKLVPDLLKRAIERGIEAGLNSLGNAGRAKTEREGTVPPPPPASVPPAKEPGHREIASVPKEIAGYVFSQIDDTKNAMVRVVAREVREFLEAADLATELQKALTMLSFEIRTEIRFIPNDAGGIKPEVKAAISPKKGEPRRRAGRRPTALEAEDDEET